MREIYRTSTSLEAEQVRQDGYELELCLVGDSAAAAPSQILAELGPDQVRRVIAGAPHTIFAEVWHVAFWLEMTLDWIRGVETPNLADPADGFPRDGTESWEALHARLFAGLEHAAAATRDAMWMKREVRCPSRPGLPVRVMTAREQLESLAAHNAYHFGRVVLLRQMLGCWPPSTGGYDR